MKYFAIVRPIGWPEITDYTVELNTQGETTYSFLCKDGSAVDEYWQEPKALFRSRREAIAVMKRTFANRGIQRRGKVPRLPGNEWFEYV